LAATIPKELTNQNVLEAFKIAYQLDLKDEKDSTFQFIWENLEEIVPTSEFKELMITYPCLVMDFMVKSKRHHTPSGELFIWKHNILIWFTLIDHWTLSWHPCQQSFLGQLGG
jgi:hypothetical protein